MFEDDLVWRCVLIGVATAGGAPAGVVSLVKADTETFVEAIRFEGSGVHSVAVNAINHHIFVPVNGKGIFAVAPGK
jgi:hypothetical protein